MKTIRSILTLVFLAAYAAWTLSSCSTTTVHTVTTDKAGTVTQTTTTTKAADDAAMGLLGVVVTSYAPPRARTIREEKSGRITPGEIEARWKQLP